MRILQIVLIYLLLKVNTKTYGEMTVDRFKKQNCRYGGPLIDGSIMEVKTRSKLKCAAECSRQACKSYRYDKTTESCFMSTLLIDDGSGEWYCIPFIQHSIPSTCSGYFQFYMGICVTHSYKNTISTYEEMKQHCNQINGKLYQIEENSRSAEPKRHILASFTASFRDGHFVIQGKLDYCLVLAKCWKNEDGSVAVTFLSILPPADNVLAIDARTGYVDSGGIAVKTARGFICEEVHDD